MTKQDDGRPPTERSTGAVLFLALFAVQAALFVLPPVLPRLAGELSVSVATAGQLRAIVGLVAASTTAIAGFLAQRLSLRDLIAAGLSVVAVACAVAALAPDFATLAAAHVAIGLGLGVVLTAATAATAAWASPAGRTALLSRALMGTPTAAIVGTLAAGLLAGVSWRAGFALPCLACAAVAAAVLARPAGERAGRSPVRVRDLRRRPGLAGWAVGELLAYSAWAGIPTYAGALLVQSYGASPAVAAAVIGASAAAVLAGNRLTRRWVGAAPRLFLLLFALALAGVAGAFGAVRPALGFSAVVLLAAGLLTGGRSLVGSTFGLRAAPGDGVAVMAVRTTAQQLGYLFGAGLGGVAIAVAGYGGLGTPLATLFVCAGLPHALALRRITAFEIAPR